MGSDSARGRQARLLGLAAAGLAALGIVLLTLGVIGMLTTATPHMRGFNAGQMVTVSEQGISVYARQDTVRQQAVCRADDEAGTSYTFERPVETFPVDVSGTPFYEVGRSPEGMEPGRYELACEGTDQAVYAGPRADRTVAPGLVGTAGLVSGIIVLALALLLGLGALLAGRGARGRPESGQVAPMGSYPYGPPERHSTAGPGVDPYAPPAQQGQWGTDPYAPPGTQGPYGHGSAPGSQADPYGPPPGGYPGGAETRPLSDLPPPTGQPYGSRPEHTQGSPGGHDRGDARDRRDGGDDEGDGTDRTERQPPWTW